MDCQMTDFIYTPCEIPINGFSTHNVANAFNLTNTQTSGCGLSDKSFVIMNGRKCDFFRGGRLNAEKCQYFLLIAEWPNIGARQKAFLTRFEIKLLHSSFAVEVNG